MLYQIKIRNKKEITMNIFTDEQKVRKAQIKLCDKTLTSELSNDYTLPDYQPEIRRVLKVSASVIPASKYVSGSHAELGGTIEYRVLYVASDGKLYSAPLAAEYEISAPLEISPRVELGEGIILIANTTAENASARVSAPRRLNIKCRVCSDVRAFGTVLLDELVVGESDRECIQRLQGECRYEYVSASVGESKEVICEFDTPSDDVRVIDSSAELIITEAYVDSLGAKCKGELITELLVCNESTDGAPKYMRKATPFEDTVELDVSGSSCIAKGYVSDMKINVEDGKIVCLANVFAEVTAHSDDTVCYTKDLYSTECFCETAHKEESLFAPLYCNTSNFSQSERIELSEGQTAIGATAIGAYCEVCVGDSAYNDGKCTLAGSCKYTVIAKKDGEYFCFDQSAPFKYEFPIETAHSCAHFSLHPTASSARIDGSTLTLSSELYVSAELSKEFSISTLSEARFGEPLNKKSGDMIVCYPTPDDTLWSISKKYSVPTISLHTITDPEATLDGIDFIIVNP